MQDDRVGGRNRNAVGGSGSGRRRAFSSDGRFFFDVELMDHAADGMMLDARQAMLTTATALTHQQQHQQQRQQQHQNPARHFGVARRRCRSDGEFSDGLLSEDPTDAVAGGRLGGGFGRGVIGGGWVGAMNGGVNINGNGVVAMSASGAEEMYVALADVGADMVREAAVYRDGVESAGIGGGVGGAGGGVSGLGGMPGTNSCPDIRASWNLLGDGDVYEMDLNDTGNARHHSDSTGEVEDVTATTARGSGVGGGSGSVGGVGGDRLTKRRYSEGDCAQEFFEDAFARGEGGGGGGDGGGAEGIPSADRIVEGGVKDVPMSTFAGADTGFIETEVALKGDVSGLAERPNFTGGRGAGAGGGRNCESGNGGIHGLGRTRNRGHHRSASPASCPDMLYNFEENFNHFEDGDVYEMDLNDVSPVNQQFLAAPLSQTKSRHAMNGDHRAQTIKRRHSDGDTADLLFVANGGIDLLEERIQRLDDDSFDDFNDGDNNRYGNADAYHPSRSSLAMEDVHQRLISTSRRLGRASSMPFPEMAGFSLGPSSQATAASRWQLQLQFANAFGSGGAASETPPPPPTQIDTSYLLHASPLRIPNVGTTSATSSSSSLLSIPPVNPDTPRSAQAKKTCRDGMGTIAALTNRRAGSSKKDLTVVKAGKSVGRPSPTPMRSVLGCGMSASPGTVSSSGDTSIGPEKSPSPATAVGAGGNGGSGSAAVSKKRGWKKPKDKPKRPLSAYNLFFQAERNEIIGLNAKDQTAEERERQKARRRAHRKTHGKIGFAALAQTIAAKWRGMDAEERSQYESRAEVEKARYKKELEAWKLTQKEKALITEKQEKEKDCDHDDDGDDMSADGQPQLKAATANAEVETKAAATTTTTTPRSTIPNPHLHHSASVLPMAVAVCADAARSAQQQQQQQQPHVSPLPLSFGELHVGHRQTNRRFLEDLPPPPLVTARANDIVKRHATGSIDARGRSLELIAEPSTSAEEAAAGAASSSRGKAQQNDGGIQVGGNGLGVHDEDLFIGVINDDFWAEPLQENGFVPKYSKAELDASFAAADGSASDLSAGELSSVENGRDGGEVNL